MVEYNEVNATWMMRNPRRPQVRLAEPPFWVLKGVIEPFDRVIVALGDRPNEEEKKSFSGIPVEDRFGKDRPLLPKRPAKQVTPWGKQQLALRRARKRKANLWWISILWPRVIHLDFGPGSTGTDNPKTACTAETSLHWQDGEAGSWHNLIRAMEAD